jgi:hypothetical protein
MVAVAGFLHEKLANEFPPGISREGRHCRSIAGLIAPSCCWQFGFSHARPDPSCRSFSSLQVPTFWPAIVKIALLDFLIGVAQNNPFLDKGSLIITITRSVMSDRCQIMFVKFVGRDHHLAAIASLGISETAHVSRRHHFRPTAKVALTALI